MIEPAMDCPTSAKIGKLPSIARMHSPIRRQCLPRGLACGLLDTLACRPGRSSLVQRRFQQIRAERLERLTTAKDTGVAKKLLVADQLEQFVDDHPGSIKGCPFLGSAVAKRKRREQEARNNTIWRWPVRILYALILAVVLIDGLELFLYQSQASVNSRRGAAQVKKNLQKEKARQDIIHAAR